MQFIFLGKPFMDGNIIKECIVIVADNMCDTEKDKQSIRKISLSRMTITRRTEQLSQNIQVQLQDRIKDMVAFSLALDESTDMVDTAQLSVFIRGVDKNLNVTEDLLALRSMRGTTTGTDIYKEVTAAIDDRKLDLAKLTAIVTDGAPSMKGARHGFTTMLLDKLETDKITPALHCIIHQENLAAKTLGMKHVIKVVKETVNIIRSRGLKHRQLRQYLSEIDAEYEDVPYYAEVRWLSKGKMMERTYKLTTEIRTFCESNGRDLPEFGDPGFLNDFAFLVDVLTHLNKLNAGLQGKDKLVSDLYHQVGTFDGMLDLWLEDFDRHCIDPESFPMLTCRPGVNEDPLVLEQYKAILKRLSEELKDRFIDFKNIKNDICAFSAITQADVPRNLKLEVIKLKNDPIYSPQFAPGENLLKAYQSLPSDNYPKLREFAGRMISMFGSTYRCEQLFSTMGYAKNKFRSRLTDSHLADILHISASDLQPDYKSLLAAIQCQPSH